MLNFVGRRILQVCVIAALAVPLSAAFAAGSGGLPLRALFDRPRLGDLALSPTGRWLAAAVPGRNQGRLELVVADLSVNPLDFKSVAWLKDYDVARVAWLNDKRLVFTAYDSQAGAWAGETGLWAADLDGGDNRLLIDPYWMGFRAVQPVSRQILPAEWEYFGVPSGGSDDVLVLRRGWSSFESRATYALFRMNTREPRPRRLDEGAPDGVFDWVLDDHDRPQWLQAQHDGKRRVYRRSGPDQWQKVAEFDALRDEGWSPQALVGDELLVAFEPNGQRGSQLFLWDAEHTRPAEQPLLRAEGFDVGDTAWPLTDEVDHRPLGWRYRLDTLYTRWTDDTMATAQASLDRALPGRVNLIRCNACLHAQRWLVASLSDRHPAQYYIFERASGRLVPLGSARPDIPESGLGARSFHRAKTRDGLDLPIYLTRPVQDLDPKSTPQPRPVVVYVHGGPQSRVRLEWGGDAVPQFLASRGYVVIEPDFRGSAGYGSAHEISGFGQWGLAMQDDLKDALDWAAAQGLADPKRACIMGASYGGYAALMGPVRHPGVYRCAIAWLAPTDLPRLNDDQADLTPMNRLLQEHVSRLIGPDGASRSPLRRVAEMKVPILAAWGVEDRRVPVAHGRDFRDAAKAAGVDLEYVEYPKEGHGWMFPENNLDFFGRAEKLLARTLGTP